MHSAVNVEIVVDLTQLTMNEWCNLCQNIISLSPTATIQYYHCSEMPYSMVYPYL